MGSVGMIMTRDSSCYPRQLRYAKAGRSQGPSNLGSRGWLDQSVTCTAGYSDRFERTGQSQQRKKWSETECTKTRFVGHDVHEDSFPPSFPPVSATMRCRQSRPEQGTAVRPRGPAS